MIDTLKSTLVMKAPLKPPNLFQKLLSRGKLLLSNVWSSTQFEEATVTGYAEDLMLAETRKGITVMALLSLVIQISSIALYQKMGVHGAFLYTYGLLALLSIHIIASVRYVTDLSALNLLGMILLVITGVAIMTIAHRTGSLNSGLMSSIVLLFMVMPLVPWGVREASIIVSLTYITFTLSIVSVEGRFDSQSMWTVQFLILAAATTAVLIIGRNTVVRKGEIRTRYDLEGAHRELQLISTRDPLTGAWNRRFIEQNFDEYARRCYADQEQVQLALMDIDKFKYFNDTFGHHHGDLILQHLANVFIEMLPGNTHLIRLGGDEFAIVYRGDDFKRLVGRCLNHLLTDPILLQVSDGEPVTVAVGFAKGTRGRVADITELYKKADEALYEAKSKKVRWMPVEDSQTVGDISGEFPAVSKV
jgi:diguanylate cyclase (GGDEF)-like protein